jgi:hypothetical protein
MTHEDGTSRSGDQLVDAACPRPVLRVCRPGHPWRLHPIARSQGIPEERLPVHSAAPAAGLTGAVNSEDGARHGRNVSPSSRAIKRGGRAAHCSLLHQVTLQDERATLPRSTWLIALSFWPRENSRVLVAPAPPLRHFFVCSQCLGSSLSSGLVSCSRSAPSAPSRARPTSSRSNGTAITSEQRMMRTNSDAGQPEKGIRATAPCGRCSGPTSGQRHGALSGRRLPACSRMTWRSTCTGSAGTLRTPARRHPRSR